MHATAAIAHKAACLCIPCSSGLAGVSISTPRTTPGKFALEENVEGRVPRAELCREQPELLTQGERVEVALH
jgi:hypothetical protein